MEDSDN
jgi:hypothetical protein